MADLRVVLHLLQPALGLAGLGGARARQAHLKDLELGKLLHQPVVLGQLLHGHGQRRGAGDLADRARRRGSVGQAALPGVVVLDGVSQQVLAQLVGEDELALDARILQALVDGEIGRANV